MWGALLLLLVTGIACQVQQVVADSPPRVQECEEWVSSLDYSQFLRSSLGGELSCISGTPHKRCCAKVLQLFGGNGSAPLCLCNADFYSAWMAILPGLVGVNPDTYVDMLAVCKVPTQVHSTCSSAAGMNDGPRVQGQILSTLTALLTGRHQGRIAELVPWITSHEPQESSSKEASSESGDEPTDSLQISSDANELVIDLPLCSSQHQESACQPPPMASSQPTAVPEEEFEDCESLVQIARRTPKLTAFVQILDVARLASTIQDGFMGTVFAPSNSAFASLLEELGGLPFNVLIDPENEDILVKILKTHVVPGRQVGLDITKHSVQVPTLLEKGQDLEIIVKDGDLNVAASGNNMSIPVENTVTSCSSVLHILGGVLLPAEGLNQSG